MSTSILNYIAVMDAATVDNPTGDGVCIMALPTGTGTATCGVVGLATLLTPEVKASGDWGPIAQMALSALDSTGTTDGYHPAWGAMAMPSLVSDGAAHELIESQSLLPPLFSMAFAGATAEATLAPLVSAGGSGATADISWPPLAGYAIDDSFRRTATGAAALPALAGTAQVCGLDTPIASGATSAAIVNLLQQGNTTLADAAAAICAYDETDDERAISVVYFVSNLLTYVQDGDGIGDRWTCALATWFRRYGDCEDGAILIHALLLAAGVDPGRIRTAFGTVMTTNLTEVGHAWVMYRRLTDEEWIPLEWTFQPSPYDIEAWQVKRQLDMTATYTAISYILTDELFSQVTDSNYIAHLAANRSTAAGVLPALASTATTSVAARASLTLAAVSAAGRTGALATATFPSATGTAIARAVFSARGDMALSLVQSSGTTGGLGSGALWHLAATGRCGTSATGKANFPALSVAASADVESLAWAGLDVPAITLRGKASVGSIGVGDAVFPLPQTAGRIGQGPVALGVATLSRLHCTGNASPLLAAMGVVDFPPVAGRGHAVGATSWTKVLQHNPRWLG